MLACSIAAGRKARFIGKEYVIYLIVKRMVDKATMQAIRVLKLQKLFQVQ